MNDALNKRVIRGHEGLRLKPYLDTAGKLTVGTGFNLDAPGAAAICARVGVLFGAVHSGHPITLEQENAIFEIQYAAAAADARKVFPKIDSYPDNAGAVVCDMIFELGLEGFTQFSTFAAAIMRGDWLAAAQDLQRTKLHSEVPGRVDNNIAILQAILQKPIPPASQAGYPTSSQAA